MIEFIFIIILVSILSGSAVEIIKALAKNRGGGPKVLEEVKKLRLENEQLKQRTENLEYIVTGADGDLLEDLSRLKLLQEKEKNTSARPTSRQSGSTYADSFYGTDEPKMDDSPSRSEVEQNIRTVLNKVVKKIDNLLEDKKSR